MERARTPPGRALALGLLAALALPLAPGCGTGGARKAIWQLGIPGVESPFVVTSTTRRGAYLDVTLAGGGYTLRSFAPASEACLAVLETEERVQWVASGSTGAFRRQGRECRAAGIGSLHEWRARGPRPQTLTETPVPREQASYRAVYRDEDVVMLRGRFPLARLLGWSELGDTIAVVPRTEACDGPASRSTSSMEYRPSGRPVLALVSEHGLFAIVGLLRPQGPSAASGSSAPEPGS